MNNIMTDAVNTRNDVHNLRLVAKTNRNY